MRASKPMAGQSLTPGRGLRLGLGSVLVRPVGNVPPSALVATRGMETVVITEKNTEHVFPGGWKGLAKTMHDRYGSSRSHALGFVCSVCRSNPTDFTVTGGVYPSDNCPRWCPDCQEQGDDFTEVRTPFFAEHRIRAYYGENDTFMGIVVRKPRGGALIAVVVGFHPSCEGGGRDETVWYAEAIMVAWLHSRSVLKALSPFPVLEGMRQTVALTIWFLLCKWVRPWTILPRRFVLCLERALRWCITRLPLAWWVLRSSQGMMYYALYRAMQLRGCGEIKFRARKGFKGTRWLVFMLRIFAGATLSPVRDDPDRTYVHIPVT